jgi:acyl-CoA thioesterase-1
MDALERSTKTGLALGIVAMLIFSGLVAIGCLDFDRNLHMTKVACVGDSITMGSTYPDKLQVMLGSYYSVKNFGLSGSTVSMDSKLPYMEAPQFQWAKNFQPDIVLIILGTNDANPEVVYNETSFESDYTELVCSFLQLESAPQVVVVNSPPMFVESTSPYNNTCLTIDLFPKIENVADLYDLYSVDLYTTFGNHSDYFMDGIHPNERGSQLIASTLCEAVTEIQENL